MNQSSSRSHAILVVGMEQRALPSAAKALPAELRYLRSKLHLVDLAGSERAKETGTTGEGRGAERGRRTAVVAEAFTCSDDTTGTKYVAR
jgi:hypothetical protein